MNNHGAKNSSMMWMMLICCGLPLAVLFFASGGINIKGYFLPILFGVIVIFHIVMMFRGHSRREITDAESEATKGGKDKIAEKQEHIGSCH